MLKKQTVWLLTMLSLMIVLSAYYMMSDQEDVAYIDTEQEPFEETVQQEEEATDETEEADDADDVVIDDMEEVHHDELFTTIRMELEDDRNIKMDRLKDIVASSEATATEVNSALDEMDELETMTTKESILQESILSTNEAYEDVLVRAEEDKVHVHIIADELPKNEAVQIMQMVKDELGERTVDVNFQPTNT